MKVSIISSLIALVAVANAAPSHQGARPVGWGSPVNVVKRVAEPVLESRGGGYPQGGHDFSADGVAKPILESRGGGFAQGGASFGRGGRGKREDVEGGESILESRGGGFAQGGASFGRGGRGKRGYGESGSGKPGKWTPPQLFNNDKFPLGVNPQSQQFNGSPQRNSGFQPTQQPQDSRANLQQPPQGQELPVNQLAGSNINTNQPIPDQESQLAVNNAAVLSPNTADTTETEFAEVQMNGGSTIQVPMGTIFPVSSTAPATQMITNSGHCMAFTPGTDNAQPRHIPGADFSSGSPANGLVNGDVVGFVWCQQKPFAGPVKQAFDIRNLN